MSESIKTIGQLLYDGIDENEYLNEIYDSILFNYTAGLFKLDVARKDIDLAHALRFSDILSKSVDVERGDKHRNMGAGNRSPAYGYYCSEFGG